MAQTTEAVTVQGLLDGESALLLDGYLHVAVSCELRRDSVNSIITAAAHARAINADGSPMHDAHDQPVETWHMRSCPADGINDPTIGGQSGLARQAVLIAIGDESDDALGHADDNIRHAVQAASMTGAVNIAALDIED